MLLAVRVASAQPAGDAQALARDPGRGFGGQECCPRQCAPVVPDDACTTCSAASRLLAGLTTTDARAPPAPWRSLHRSFEGAGHDGAAPFELLRELSPVSSIGIFWLCAAPCLWLQPSAQMPGRAARSDRVRVPSSRGRTGSLLEAAGLVVSSATYRGGAAISRDTLRRRQRNTTDAARRCVRQPLSADLAIQHAASPVASAPFMTASAAVEAAAACP